MEELRVAKTEVSAARAKIAVYKASVIANNAFLVGTSTKIRFLLFTSMLTKLIPGKNDTDSLFFELNEKPLFGKP